MFEYYNVSKAVQAYVDGHEAPLPQFLSPEEAIACANAAGICAEGPVPFVSFFSKEEASGICFDRQLWIRLNVYGVPILWTAEFDPSTSQVRFVPRLGVEAKWEMIEGRPQLLLEELTTRLGILPVAFQMPQLILVDTSFSSLTGQPSNLVLMFREDVKVMADALMSRLY